jgi:hypothetical protein
MTTQIYRCQHCGNEFERAPYYIRGKRVFCSLDCNFLARRGEHRKSDQDYKCTYRKVRDANGRLRLEHRILMERKLGRPLLDSEIVHHMDENTLNNNPDNLELTTFKDHIPKFHSTMFSTSEIQGMFLRGMACFDIAKVIGCSVDVVRRRVKPIVIGRIPKRHGTL